MKYIDDLTFIKFSFQVVTPLMFFAVSEPNVTHCCLRKETKGEISSLSPRTS